MCCLWLTQNSPQKFLLNFLHKPALYWNLHRDAIEILWIYIFNSNRHSLYSNPSEPENCELNSSLSGHGLAGHSWALTLCLQGDEVEEVWRAHVAKVMAEASVQHAIHTCQVFPRLYRVWCGERNISAFLCVLYGQNNVNKNFMFMTESKDTFIDDFNDFNHLYNYKDLFAECELVLFL